MTPSPEERVALREQHRQQAKFYHVCFESWPCATIRLLDALEAAEQQVEDLERRLGNHWCSYQDGSYTCEECTTWGHERKPAAVLRGGAAWLT